MAENVLWKSEEVRDRLSELGLQREYLIEAAKRGMAARFSCTANHPPLAPGFYGWAETVTGLRDVLMPVGWLREDTGLLSLVVSPDGKTAIAAATGDEFTGIADESPCSKSPKGQMTKDRVEENAIQLHLFEYQKAIETPEQIKAVNSRLTYWLLFHLDFNEGVMRCELSTPVSMDSEGKIAVFDERIILGDVPFDSEPEVVGVESGPEPDSGVMDDIQVKRRG